MLTLFNNQVLYSYKNLSLILIKIGNFGVPDQIVLFPE